MKAIVLGAGYATRLYPLTKDRPKPLLEVSEKTILDYIVEKMEKVNEIDEVVIVTNHKFTTHFGEWAKEAFYTKKLTVVNDGTMTNKTRLGSIGDIQFVIEHLNIEDDLMILSGDNLFDFELTDFATYFKQVGTDCITAYHEDNDAQLKRSGIVELDEKAKILSFEEKSEEPKSSYCVPAFYLYKKETLPLFKQYLSDGHSPVAPGNFVPFLIEQKEVHAYLLEGKRYDIETVESYKKVKEIFTSE